MVPVETILIGVVLTGMLVVVLKGLRKVVHSQRSESRVCTKCNAPIQNDAQYCGRCGTALAQNATQGL